MEGSVKSYLLINGQQLKAREYVPVINPANAEEVVGYIPTAEKEDVERAIGAAAAAFPKWSSTPARERVDRLRSAAQALASRTKDLAPLLVRENGKLLSEAEVDIRRAVESLEYVCKFGEEFEAPESYETKG